MTTTATRMERSELEHFLIRRLREISCAQERALDQERIIREVTNITPIMIVKTKGIQGPGLNPSGDILLDLLSLLILPVRGLGTGF